MKRRVTAASYVITGPDAHVSRGKPAIGRPSKTAAQWLRLPGLATSCTKSTSADNRLETTTADNCAMRHVMPGVTPMQSLMKSFLLARSMRALDQMSTAKLATTEQTAEW